MTLDIMAEANKVVTYGLSVAAALSAGLLCGHLISRRLSSLSSTSAIDSKLLVEAINYSTDKHKEQKRKNPKQTPYICHPVRVARLLSNDAGITDVNVIIAALLHDTVEDTDATLDEIELLFGSQIAKIVDEVTDDKSLPKQARKQNQIDHAPHASLGAKLVKLADKLDNLSDLLTATPVGWGPDRVAEYFEWAEKVIHGLRGTNQVLESRLDEVLAARQKAVDVAAACAT